MYIGWLTCDIERLAVAELVDGASQFVDLLLVVVLEVLHVARVLGLELQAHVRYVLGILDYGARVRVQHLWFVVAVAARRRRRG